MNKYRLARLFIVGVVLLMPITSMACHSCKAHVCKTMGKNIQTFGGLRCEKAKSVYNAFMNGKTPKGWICGQSVGGCGKGKQGFYFH